MGGRAAAPRPSPAFVLAGVFVWLLLLDPSSSARLPESCSDACCVLLAAQPEAVAVFGGRDAEVTVKRAAQYCGAGESRGLGDGF